MWIGAEYPELVVELSEVGFDQHPASPDAVGDVIARDCVSDIGVCRYALEPGMQFVGLAEIPKLADGLVGRCDCAVTTFAASLSMKEM